MGLTIQLSTDHRLAILRESDENRMWRALDERRVCMGCSRVFSGQEVRITTDTDGRYQLHCPTDDCASAPRDWFFYGSGIAPDHAGATPPHQAEIDLNFG